MANKKCWTSSEREDLCSQIADFLKDWAYHGKNPVREERFKELVRSFFAAQCDQRKECSANVCGFAKLPDYLAERGYGSICDFFYDLFDENEKPRVQIGESIPECPQKTDVFNIPGAILPGHYGANQ